MSMEAAIFFCGCVCCFKTQLIAVTGQLGYAPAHPRARPGILAWILAWAINCLFIFFNKADFAIFRALALLWIDCYQRCNFILT